MTRITSGGVSGDRKLLARAVAGDRRALGELYDRHASQLYGLALAICGTSALAQQAMEELFGALAAGHLDRGREAGVAAWLGRHLRARALTLLRAEGGHAAVNRIRDRPDAVGLDRLADDERHMLEMAYFRGMTVAEIAAILNETEVTICATLHTAMLTLRQEMGVGAPPRAMARA